MARDHLEEEALIALSRMQRETFDARPNGTGPDIPPNVLAAMKADPPRGFRSPWHKERRNGR